MPEPNLRLYLLWLFRLLIGVSRMLFKARTKAPPLSLSGIWGRAYTLAVGFHQLFPFPANAALGYLFSLIITVVATALSACTVHSS